MKHSNIYHELGQGYRRRQVWGWVIAIALISFSIWLIYTIDMNNVAAASGYGIAVRNCIETRKELNQNYANIHVDVQACINNPTIIK